MVDVVALGELLIDFTSCGESAQGNPVFEANPGGAPCNVLAMLARLGRTTAFLGKVGDDMFGSQLETALQSAGIETAGLVKDEVQNTTLAFVKNLADGDRLFSFVRNPGADTQLHPEEVNETLAKQARLFHFGSLSLTHAPARAATAHALGLARDAGACVSFDPNLRPALWATLAQAKEQMLWGIGQCDVLKLSEEELVFLTDRQDMEAGAACIRAQFPHVKLLLVTCGKQGAWAFAGEHSVFVAASAHKAIDTTGAGDTFFGSCLHFVLEQGETPWTEQALLRMLTFANTAAGIITTRKGALAVMPTRTEVEQALPKENA